MAFPFARTSTANIETGSQLLWTVGPMLNTSPTRALGVTVSAGLVENGNRFTLEGRRRWWSSESNGFDLSMGLLQIEAPDGAIPNRSEYGLTAGAFAIGGDMIHANAHVDLLLTGGKVHALGTIGGGLGSQAAVVVSVLATALAFAALSGGLGN